MREGAGLSAVKLHHLPLKRHFNIIQAVFHGPFDHVLQQRGECSASLLHYTDKNRMLNGRKRSKSTITRQSKPKMKIKRLSNELLRHTLSVYDELLRCRFH